MQVLGDSNSRLENDFPSSSTLMTIAVSAHAAAAAARAKSEEASVLETTNTLFLLGHLGHNPGYAPVQVRRGE